MGAFDGAECCELVGLYLLQKLSTIVSKEDIGLYRDDGLMAIKGNGQEMERFRKKLFSLFRQEGLSITAETNLLQVDFLDVTLNLEDGSFKPFSKPNEEITYVSKLSNHPPLVLKNIPMGINKRLSTISSNEEEFNREKHRFDKALKEASYDHELRFLDDNAGTTNKKKRRRRNVLWFNPPFSLNVKTNIGKKFFAILDKHFPKGSPLSKLFNRKTVKLSYSCMQSMQSFISGHNKKILSTSPEVQLEGCNCTVRACMLDGHCKTRNVVYRATVNSSDGEKEYIGQTKTTFKARWKNHNSDHNLPHRELSTSLSGYIWNLKRKNMGYDIKWSIVQLAVPYKKETKRCELCLTEKTLIAMQDKDTAVNKRREVMEKCRHKGEVMLSNWKTGVG